MLVSYNAFICNPKELTYNDLNLHAYAADFWSLFMPPIWCQKWGFTFSIWKGCQKRGSCFPWGKKKPCLNQASLSLTHSGDCITWRIKCFQGLQEAEGNLSFSQSFSSLRPRRNDAKSRSLWCLLLEFSLFRECVKIGKSASCYWKGRVNLLGFLRI